MSEKPSHLKNPELFRRYSQANNDGLKLGLENDIAAANLPLVKSIATAFRFRGVNFDDLLAQGREGLLVAIRKFDPGRGFKFSTYATWWIKQRITRYLLIHPDFRVVDLPIKVQNRIISAYEYEDELREKGADVDLAELARRARFSEGDFANIRRIMAPTLSLNTPVDLKGSGKPMLLENKVESKYGNPEDELRISEAWGRVLPLIASFVPLLLDTRILFF